MISMDNVKDLPNTDIIKFPILFKKNFNNDIYVTRIEIKLENNTINIVRSSGKLFMKEVVTIDEESNQTKAINKAAKFYSDKFNSGYRPIEYSVDSMKSFVFHFPIGSFHTILENIQVKQAIGIKSTYGYYDPYVNNESSNISYTHREFINKHISNTTYDKNNLIKPMKAKPFEESRMDYPALAQGKLNGVRCTIHYRPASSFTSTNLFDKPVNKVELISREGIRYEVPKVEIQLLRYFKEGLLDANTVYDGELYCPGIPVASIAGAARNRSNNVNELLMFVIFDICDDILNQQDRINHLQECLLQGIHRYTHAINKDIYESVISNRNDVSFHNLNKVWILDTYVVNSDAEFTEFAMDAIEYNYEGGILRDREALYQFGAKRYNMMKLKKPSFTECKVIDVIPLKKDPTLGMFLLQNDINIDTFECSINTTAINKAHILLNKKDWIGKKVSVRFFERTVYNIPFHANVIL